MLKEKVEEILSLVSGMDTIRKKIDALEIQKRMVGLEAITLKQTISNKKNELGKMIADIPSNIILDLDGKFYCLFYNKKYNTASIIPALTIKEAEILLSVKKLQTGEEEE